MTQLVTGDTAPGDTEARQVRQRGTPEGAAHVHIASGGGSFMADTDGDSFSLDDPAEFDYNADGTVNYVEVTSGDVVRRRTFTYTDGNLTSYTGWVKQ